MIFAERLVMMLSLSLMILAVEAHPPKIGAKIPSRLNQGLLMVGFTTLICGGGFVIYQLLPGILQDVGNQVILQPVLLGFYTGSLAIALWFRIRGDREKFPVAQQQLLLLVPVMVNVAMAGAEGKNYWLGLLFYLVSGSLLVGIQDRIRYAPIPQVLQGLPIQMISLLLIFLGLSFFRGVFFGEIF